MPFTGGAVLTASARNATCIFPCSSVALARIWLNQQSSSLCFSQSIHNSFYFCKHSTCLSMSSERIAPGARCKIIKYNSPFYSITLLAFVSLSLTNIVLTRCYKRKEVMSKCGHRSHSKSWMILRVWGVEM